MELLIGCGNDWKKKVSFPQVPAEWCELVTMDWDEACKPHVVHDLTKLPWPFQDDTFDEVHGYEVLEHLGQQGDYRSFFEQFTEIWRVLKPGGYLVATVPLWDSMWAWGDPGHRRIINEGSLVFLSQKEYQKQVGKTAMADYRFCYEADFDIIATMEKGDTFGFVLKAIKGE